MLHLSLLFALCIIFSLNQAIDTRIKLALALAKQWFGVYITAEDPVDGTLSNLLLYDVGICIVWICNLGTICMQNGCWMGWLVS